MKRPLGGATPLARLAVSAVKSARPAAMPAMMATMNSTLIPMLSPAILNLCMCDEASGRQQQRRPLEIIAEPCPELWHRSPRVHDACCAAPLLESFQKPAQHW